MQKRAEWRRVKAPTPMESTTTSTIDAPLQQRGARGRFAHLDLMRAFAVLLVVLAHAGLSASIPGGTGVTVFFAISGFIITWLLLQERNQTGSFSLRGFYFRRAAKIVPPLVVAIVIPSLIFATQARFDWQLFAGQLFFYSNLIHPVSHLASLPGSGVVWSLAIEEQFYIAVALVWLFISRLKNRLLWLGTTSIVVVVVATVDRLSHADGTARMSAFIYDNTLTRVDGIAWGMLTAVVLVLASARGFPTPILAILRSKTVVLVSAVIVLASLLVREQWFRDTFRYTLQSLAACLIILYGAITRPWDGGSSRLSKRLSQGAVTVGLASYSIYIVHFPLMAVVGLTLGGLPSGVLIITKVFAGIGGGLLLYFLVEVPVLRWRRRGRA